MAAASTAILALLLGTAVAQMIVIKEVGDLGDGGRQLVLGGAPLAGFGGGAPVAARPGSGQSAVLLRLRQAPAPPAATAFGGGQGFGSGRVLGARRAAGWMLGDSAGPVFEARSSSVWMPRGDGRVQRQEVEVEKVSSDGLRQVRRVSCESGRCDTEVATDHALLPAAARQVQEQHNWATNAASELLSAPDPEQVAREKLAQLEESVDDQADDEAYTKDGDADDSDDIRDYQDGLRKAVKQKLRGAHGSDPTDDDADSEIEFDIDEANPVKSMMQIMHARDTVEVNAQKDVTDQLIARAEAFQKRLDQQALLNVAKRKAVEGQFISTINEEARAPHGPGELTLA